ncbi:hypothetical protein PV326_008640 [Microctonus aethiopoides]|nr:hypothetical protein PV326_008640 [Microctonus aethiopoides]
MNIGPNVYTLPSTLGGTREGNKKTAPSYSIASRQKISTDDRILFPGPGTYEVIKPDIVRVKSAAYTISGRYRLPNDHAEIPAPGAYNPEKSITMSGTGVANSSLVDIGSARFP